MKNHNHNSARKREGFALVLSMVLLVMCASLAIAMLTSTSLELKKSDNLRQSHKAQLAAESGLDFLTYTLRNLELGDSVQDQSMLDDLASVLQSNLNGTGNLGNGAVTYDGSTIAVPSITMADDTSFTGTLTLVDATTIRLTVVGQCTDGEGGSLSRTLSLDFASSAKPASFEYGIYSKGPIVIGGNFDYRGVNAPAEASLYTEDETAGWAVTIGNNGYVDGDIDLKYEFGMVSLGSNTDVNGEVNAGVPPSQIPQVDPSVFAGYATTVMDASTPRSSVTLTNLRIPANTNPEFESNVVLKGVTYIEAPNYVVFKNNVDVVGVIVTEDGAASGGVNKIEFKNNLDITGVENLATPEFAALRQMTGSAILAPGFDLEFKNNFISTGGTIACEQLIIKNNFEATIKGAVIIYGSTGLTFDNNAILKIDRSSLTGLPSGLTAPGTTILTAQPDSYQEP